MHALDIRWFIGRACTWAYAPAWLRPSCACASGMAAAVQSCARDQLLGPHSQFWMHSRYACEQWCHQGSACLPQLQERSC